MNPFIIASSYIHSGVAFSVWAEDSDNSESALAESVKCQLQKTPNHEDMRLVKHRFRTAEASR